MSLSRQSTLKAQDTEREQVVVPARPDEARRAVVDLVGKTNFEDEQEFNRLNIFFEECLKRYFLEDKSFRYFLHHLAGTWPTLSSDGPANLAAQRFYEKKGYPWLRLLVENYVYLFDHEKLRLVGSSQDETEDQSSDAEPPFLQTALIRGNQFFIDCLLHISEDEGLNIWADMLSQPFTDNQNCLHLAILKEMSSSLGMIRKCSQEALLQADDKGDQPLHVAMRQTSVGRTGRGGAGKLQLPEPSGKRYTSNSSLRRMNDYRDLGGSGRSNEATGFDSSDVYREMKLRAMAIPQERRSAFMVSLLASVNKKGRSPYQLRLQTKLDSSTSKDATDLKTKEQGFREEMKQDIFQYLTKITDVRKALYGTEGMLLHTSDYMDRS